MNSEIEQLLLVEHDKGYTDGPTVMEMDILTDMRTESVKVLS